MRIHLRLIAITALLTGNAGLVQSQQLDALSPEVRKFLRVDTPKVVLTHVEIIDGTGAAARPDQNVYLAEGKIVGVTAGADETGAADTTVLDLRGYTVMPGIVGMHNHLFYVAMPNLDAGWNFDPPLIVPQMTFSAPRLYLANGVTTMRTTGSVEPNTDLGLKREIEAGRLPGPHLDVTGPYLEGRGSYFIQMLPLTSPQDARQTVDYWADRGVTSFKAYMHITRDELRAAVDEAHKRGLKVTGHLCSVTYEEAIDIGIDDLEHGFFVDTELDPDKKPDTCSQSTGDFTLEHLIPGSPEANHLIGRLVSHHVAITSTLPVFEDDVPGRPPPRPAAMEAMSATAREAYLYRRNRPAARPSHRDGALLLRRDMDLERAFVAAGGLLLAGPDPTGDGGVVPGFGDQREIELLVEAGFTSVEAIRIATLNGAVYLGRDKQIGSLESGKDADLMVVKGDPNTRIEDIENTEMVFKDGVGYDTRKLLQSVRGHYGQY